MAAPLQAETIEYVYDVHGRLILVRHVTTAQTAYVYDPADNRTQMITALPGAPVPGVDIINTAKNTAVTFDPRTNDADGDGNALTVTGKTNGTNGTVAYTSSSLTYTPTSSTFVGTDTFTYTVSDGTNTATGTVNVTVNSTNSPPNAGPDKIRVPMNTAGNYYISGTYFFNPTTNDSDPNSDTLSISGKTNGAHGIVGYGGNTIGYQADIDYVGSDSFTYTISDGNGGTATTTVVVTVNGAPTAVNDSVTAPKNSTGYLFNPRTNDTDPNGDALTITALGTGADGPQHGTATINSGATITYIPTTAYAGSDSFKYTISDGTLTSTATVSVTVSNTAPVAVADNRSVSKNNAYTFDPRSNDSDPNGDSFTITGKTDGAHGTVTYNSTSVTYTPATNYTGSDSFTYTISDGALTHSATVSVTVINNQFPTAADDIYSDTNVTNNEGSSMWGDIPVAVLSNDSDSDGGTLSINSFSQGLYGGTVTQSGNTLIYHAGGPTGSVYDTFTYTVDDGQGGTDTGTVTIDLTEQVPG
eukprot:gene13293-13071_t